VASCNSGPEAGVGAIQLSEDRAPPRSVSVIWPIVPNKVQEKKDKLAEFKEQYPHL
jgi:hypothetical protein